MIFTVQISLKKFILHSFFPKFFILKLSLHLLIQPIFITLTQDHQSKNNLILQNSNYPNQCIQLINEYYFQKFYMFLMYVYHLLSKILIFPIYIHKMLFIIHYNIKVESDLLINLLKHNLLHFLMFQLLPLQYLFMYLMSHIFLNN